MQPHSSEETNVHYISTLYRRRHEKTFFIYAITNSYMKDLLGASDASSLSIVDDNAAASPTVESRRKMLLRSCSWVAQRQTPNCRWKIFFRSNSDSALGMPPRRGLTDVSWPASKAFIFEEDEDDDSEDSLSIGGSSFNEELSTLKTKGGFVRKEIYQTDKKKSTTAASTKTRKRCS
jgi:hypothetical protein